MNCRDSPACDALIALDRVGKVFPRGRVTALSELSVAFRRGEYAAVTGPSGSGKSTLLYLAAGLDRPTQGRVLFEGRAPGSAAEWARLRARRIGFVFQSFHLINSLTAEENVEIPMFGVEPSERARRTRTGELLRRVGLADRARSLASDLSGGECQRVAVARALANCPDLILADEPTGNLDSANKEEVLALLESLHRQEAITLVIVTHDAALARRAGRQVQLLDGRLVGQDGEAP